MIFKVPKNDGKLESRLARADELSKHELDEVYSELSRSEPGQSSGVDLAEYQVHQRKSSQENLHKSTLESVIDAVKSAFGFSAEREYSRLVSRLDSRRQMMHQAVEKGYEELNNRNELVTQLSNEETHYEQRLAINNNQYSKVLEQIDTLAADIESLQDQGPSASLVLHEHRKEYSDCLREKEKLRMEGKKVARRFVQSRQRRVAYDRQADELSVRLDAFSEQELAFAVAVDALKLKQEVQYGTPSMNEMYESAGIELQKVQRFLDTKLEVGGDASFDDSYKIGGLEAPQSDVLQQWQKLQL